MNLKNMSVAELNKLKVAIEKEISSRKKTQRNKALGEIKNIAAKYGLKLAEVVGESATPARRRKAKGKQVANKKAKSAEKKVLYRHPENPQLTWSGGRGRRPQWIKDWEAAGHSLDEAKVA